jgi:signal peptidase I
MKPDRPLIAILSALVLVTLVYAWLFDNVKMGSAAMEPAIEPGDYLLVWCAAYAIRLPLIGEVVRTGDPAWGDIVLVRKAPEGGKGSPTLAVLRVVGLPGEVVGITDKRVSIDGRQLPEAYASFTDDRVYPAELSPRDNMAAVVVEENAYFLMGDRRDVTTDSRFFGTVDRDEIVGRVVWAYW